jgi:hypothetical protein
MNFAPYSDNFDHFSFDQTYQMCGGAIDPENPQADIVSRIQGNSTDKENTPIIPVRTATNDNTVAANNTTVNNTTANSAVVAATNNTATNPVISTLPEVTVEKEPSFFSRIWEEYQSYIIAFIVIVILLIILLVVVLFSGGSNEVVPTDYYGGENYSQYQ